VKILVTGGAGFIGHNLVRYIGAADDTTEIWVIDDLSTGNAHSLRTLDHTFVRGTILDSDCLDMALRGADAIIHLAALPSVPRSVKDPIATHEANANGTLQVLEGARRHGVRHVVVASSSSVYGSNPKLPKHELDWTRPMSPYAASKLAAEAYALAYQATYGLDVTVFRFFNVFGPGQSADHAYAAVIPRFLSAALKDEAVQIEGDGEQSRDFTYVDTVCSVLWQTVKRSVVDEHPINLAWGSSTSILELIDLVEHELGAEVRREFVPPRVGDVRASQADSTRLRTHFPDVEQIPLAQGLRRTLEWMRRIHQLSDCVGTGAS